VRKSSKTTTRVTVDGKSIDRSSLSAAAKKRLEASERATATAAGHRGGTQTRRATWMDGGRHVEVHIEHRPD
jgi:hypothetical protein